MKSNGHIVLSLGWGVAREIIPDYANPAASRIVWSCPADGQIHTAQPIGPDKVFVIDNSPKPKAKLFDETDEFQTFCHTFRLEVFYWTLAAGSTRRRFQRRRRRL